MRTSPVPNPRINDCFMVFLNGWQIMHEPLVLSYFQGDCARYYETVSDSVLQADTMTALRDILGGATLNTQLVDPYKMKRTRWGSRKNFGMVYTTLGLGTTNDDLLALVPPFGNTESIHLAGEHTAFPSNGYVHGARNTGISVGQRVVQKQLGTHS